MNTYSVALLTYLYLLYSIEADAATTTISIISPMTINLQDTIQRHIQTHAANLGRRDYQQRGHPHRREQEESLCTMLGQQLMAGENKECTCTNSITTMTIDCSLEATCDGSGTAYNGEGVCYDGDSFMKFRLGGLETLNDLMMVGEAQRPHLLDLGMQMEVCYNFVNHPNPNVGELCFSVVMIMTFYLREEREEEFKFGDECEITLEGKECSCIMNQDGNTDEPCFIADCSAAVDTDFFINGCVDFSEDTAATDGVPAGAESTGGSNPLSGPAATQVAPAPIENVSDPGTKSSDGTADNDPPVTAPVPGPALSGAAKLNECKGMIGTAVIAMAGVLLFI